MCRIFGFRLNCGGKVVHQRQNLLNLLLNLHVFEPQSILTLEAQSCACVNLTTTPYLTTGVVEKLSLTIMYNA